MITLNIIPPKVKKFAEFSQVDKKRAYKTYKKIKKEVHKEVLEEIKELYRHPEIKYDLYCNEEKTVPCLYNQALKDIEIKIKKKNPDIFGD